MRELQIRYSASKLLNSASFEDGDIILDSMITYIPDFGYQGILRATISSRPKFVKLIYQSVSCFPTALYEAYKEIVGENLILDDLSEVREFYESCSKFDLWTGHELCAYISHCEPEALDFISEHPEAWDCMSEDPKNRNFNLGKLERLLPSRFSRIFLRPDLYEKNLPLVKAALLEELLSLSILSVIIG